MWPAVPCRPLANIAIHKGLFLCVQTGNADELRRMLKEGEDPYESFCGVLPMYAAICYNKPACVEVLAEYMRPGDVISSDNLTCLETCWRFHRPHLYFFFLKFESLSSLRNLYFKGEFLYDDLILKCAREKVRRSRVIRMLRQFEQVLNSDVARLLKDYI